MFEAQYLSNLPQYQTYGKQYPLNDQQITIKDIYKGIAYHRS